MQETEYFVVKIGLDTEENEPSLDHFAEKYLIILHRIFQLSSGQSVHSRPSLDVDPAGQCTHPVPAESGVTSPETSENMLYAHSKHSDAPALEPVPFGHGRQLPPAAEYWFSAQSWQDS